MPDDLEYGSFCSACDPTWFDGNKYGIGPRPEGYADKYGEHTGKWHDKFERMFLPKGMFHTNDDGNLAHVMTLDTDVDKYRLESEDRPGHRTYHPTWRLPRPSNTNECQKWHKFIKTLTFNEGEDLMSVAARGRVARAQPPRAPAVIASALALGSMGMMGVGAHGGPMREREEPKPPTAEQLAAREAASKERLAKAQAKRDRKAGRVAATPTLEASSDAGSALAEIQ